MPLSSPKRKVSDPENKLRVLFCLDALGMATLDELWPFVARLELMDYVPFCLYADELKSDGAVAAGAHALEGVLYLTEAGRQQLSLFSDKLIHADRERILKAAPAYRDELSARKQVRAVYELSQDQRYSAALTIREGDVPTLFLRLNTSDQRLIEKAVRGFHACAPLVLNLLYTIDLIPLELPVPRALTQEAAIITATAGTPSLCAFGGREHAAVVRIGDESISYTVLLLLPTAELAWSWAVSAAKNSRELAAALTVMFSDASEAQKS